MTSLWRLALRQWLRDVLADEHVPAEVLPPLSPQVAGDDRPVLPSPALNAELARLARGAVALARMEDDRSFHWKVAAMRRELLGVAAHHDHPDLVPLLILKLGEYAVAFAEQARRDAGVDP